MNEHKKLDGRKPKERESKKQIACAAETLQKEFERIDRFLKTATHGWGKVKTKGSEKQYY